MSNTIVVHPSFDGVWPFAADHLHDLWAKRGQVEFRRLEHGDHRPLGDLLPTPTAVQRLVVLQAPVTPRCLTALTSLREAAFVPSLPDDLLQILTGRGVTVHQQRSEAQWGQSVAEYALALTLCALRRIPQLHQAIQTDLGPWEYRQPAGEEWPGRRGSQFGDDLDFTNGTIAGKRVRIVGAGNIGSRYASFMHHLGGDVACWDPFAPEPAFHRSGARREHHLDELVQDAEIFAPMLPLRDSTRGILTAELLEALPVGCLVVMVTRAAICDVPALRRRVLSNQLALAADVFDHEPLPLDDPLLGRPNVVHTPHNAGRTIHANEQFAERCDTQFRAW